jgi:hypothetical protein
MPFANLSKRTQPGNPTPQARWVRATEQPSPGGLLKLAREGHPQALWLCIQLIPPPCHETHGHFCTSADREGGRCLYRDKRRILGGRSRHVHAGRKGADRAGGRNLYPAIDTTGRRRFAVNPLQILGLADFNEADDCISDEDNETCANRSRSVRHSSWLGRMSAPNIPVGWWLGGEQILPQSSARRGRAMHSGPLSARKPTLLQLVRRDQAGFGTDLQRDRRFARS